jgi:hypothetical protein
MRAASKAMLKPTQEPVHELLNYNPWTGCLIRLISTSSRSRAGDVAGWTNSDGYRRVYIDGRAYTATHVIWCWMRGEWPEETIDHIDTDSTNNRWKNLRPANDSEQQWNKGIQRNNISGVRGVHRNSRRGKWYAQIRVNNVTKFLGSFDRFEDAVAARRDAELLYHGRFARAA